MLDTSGGGGGNFLIFTINKGLDNKMKSLIFKSILSTSLLLPFALSESFAQDVSNLEQISWDAGRSMLPQSSGEYDGYFVSGSLLNGRNYFIAPSGSSEEAHNTYIKFGEFSTGGASSRIYVGGSVGGSDAYFGDITADLTGAVSLDRLYGGISFENSGYTAYVGNLNTTVNADVNINLLTIGGGQVWNAGSTLNIKSSTLVLNGGNYSSNIFGGAHTGAGAVANIENGSKLIINSANITSGGDFVVAGGSMAYGENGKGGSNISGGSSVYLGSGANFSGYYTTYIVGGNFSYQSNSGVTGGSSVTIDGATLDNVRVFGASQSSGVTAGLIASVDSSKVVVKSGTVNGDIYGGGHSQSHGSTVVEGDASVEIVGGEITGNVFGGSLYWNANHENVQASIGGNASVKITGGTVNGDVYGGSEAESKRYSGISVTNIGGSTSVEIGGEANVNGSVYGGSLSYVGSIGDGEYNTGNGAVSKVEGNSNIIISGGTVSENVYGGGRVFNSVEGTSATADLASANITISAGKISGDIYAGGDGSGSVVSGNAKVTFVGNSSDIDFAGTVYGGGSEGAIVGGKNSVSFGNSSNAFAGTFNGNISGMNELLVSSNSDVAFANSFDVDLLSVDSSSKVSLAEGTKFDKLFVNFGSETFELDGTVDISEIFGDSTSVVMSEIESGSSFVVLDAKQNLFTVGLNGSTLSITSEIPEPSTYAAILGAIALAFAAYRRRK